MAKKTSKVGRAAKSDQHEFGLSISVNRETGKVAAVYFQVRKGKAARVDEFAAGAAFANYDQDGRLLGIELLAPCSVEVLDQIAKQEPVSTRKCVKEFLRNSAPRQMVA